VLGDVLCPHIQTQIGFLLAAWPKPVYKIQKPSALSGSSYALLSRIFIVGTIRAEHDTKDMPCDV
jgi:hypothetical protein